MDQLHQDLDAKIKALTAQAEATNAKSDTLISLVGSLRTKIDELIADGQGATPEELQAMAGEIQTATDSLAAQGTENDAAAVADPDD